MGFNTSLSLSLAKLELFSLYFLLTSKWPVEDSYLSVFGNKSPIFLLRMHSFMGLSLRGLCGNDPTMALGWTHDPALAVKVTWPPGLFQGYAGDSRGPMTVSPELLLEMMRKIAFSSEMLGEQNVNLDLYQLSLPQLGSMNETKREETRDQRIRHITQNTVWDSEHSHAWN